jgi:hypothetical protein
VHDELVQQEQADIVIAAFLADLEQPVDDVEQAQQVEEEERQERQRHQRDDLGLDLGEHQQGNDHDDEADDHGVGRGQELLALDVVDAKDTLPEAGLLLTQPRDVARRDVGLFKFEERLRQLLHGRLALTSVAGVDVAVQGMNHPPTRSCKRDMSGLPHTRRIDSASRRIAWSSPARSEGARSSPRSATAWPFPS